MTKIPDTDFLAFTDDWRNAVSLGPDEAAAVAAAQAWADKERKIVQLFHPVEDARLGRASSGVFPR